jgi:hypothetical protein
MLLPHVAQTVGVLVETGERFYNKKNDCETKGNPVQASIDPGGEQPTFVREEGLATLIFFHAPGTAMSVILW